MELSEERIDQAREADAKNPPPAEQPEAYVFDSTARQRVPVILVAGEEEFEVALILDPINDGALMRYSKACEAASDEEEEDDALAGRLRAAATASTVLFDAVVTDIEGIGEEGEERPETWREFFSADEKSGFLNEAVFGYRYVEPKQAKKGKKPRWGQDLRNMTTRVAFPFEGRSVETSHTLRKADAKVYGEFNALMSRVGSVRGLDAHMLTLAAWYDEHHVAHQRYTGDVPRHHRAAVFVLHMTRQKAAVRKN